MVKMHNAKLTAIEKAARAELQATAKDVLKVAQQLAPEDEKTLIRSGKVKVDDLDVIVTFTAGHAFLQHERLDYKHTKGQAKYLEKAVEVVGVENAVVSGVQARLRRG